MKKKGETVFPPFLVAIQPLHRSSKKLQNRLTYRII